MSSSINPNNIDTAYPVAGQDNDSQGFRDNFTNIVTALDTAKEEITEIHERAVFKVAISGTALENNMDGNPLIAPTLVAPRLAILDHGSYSSGIADLDVSVGTYHKLIVEGNIDLAFSNIAPAGEHISFFVEIEVPSGAGFVDIQLPMIENDIILSNQIPFMHDNVLTLPPGTTYLYNFITTDQGNEWFMVDVIRDNNLAQRNITDYTGREGDTLGMMVTYGNRLFVCTGDWDGSTVIWQRIGPADVPASNIGAPGDRAGDIAFDATYIYTCLAHYDGSTAIWARLANGTTAW